MRKKKYTEIDFNNKCNELGLIYLGNYYKKGTGTMISFMCPKHQDKGTQTASWYHFKEATVGCPYCYGRYKTNEDIEKYIDLDTIEFISEYKGCEKPITCKCKVCGNIWDAKVHDLKKHKYGCPECAKIGVANSRMKTQEEFEKELYEANPNIQVIGEYKGVHKLVLCKCKVCGNEWNSYPANLLNKSVGCPRCNISLGERKMLDILDKLGIPYIPQYQFNDGTRLRPLRFDAYNEEFKIDFEFNGEQHYRPVDFAHNGEEWANKQFEIGQERDEFKKKYCKEHGITMVIIPYWEKENMEDFIVTKLKELKLELVS